MLSIKDHPDRRSGASGRVAARIS